MKVIGIGAHPDDIEIYMFGLLSCYLDRNDDVYVAVATDGAAGIIKGSNNLIKKREKESEIALSVFGKPFMMGLPDGNLSGANDAQKIIKEFITKIKPDLVITHSPEDYHPDHRILSYYVENAVGFKCPVLLADTLMGVNFIPEYYIDITKNFQKKSQAILAHKSQSPEKFLKATRLLNRFRSAQCNAPSGNYAEAYRFNRRFPFSDVSYLLPSLQKTFPYYEKKNNSFL